MKRSLFIILLFLSTCSHGWAVEFNLSGFSSAETMYTSLSLSTDYSSDTTSYGLTFNANLSNVNYGLESIVVNYLEYDDGILGVRYAPIEGMTFGHGLLLRDMNTLYYQPTFQKNESSGLKINYDMTDLVFEGMGTYSHLYGFQLKEISLLNMDIGFEYISDTKQISREGFGRSATGAFVDIPLSDEIGLFGESAGTSNGGQGDMAGIYFDYDMIVAYSKVSLASVSFNERFIPCYFTSGYDINPADFSSLEADGKKRRNGQIASLDIGMLGIIAMNYTSEYYKDGGTANSGSILITPIEWLSLTGFVKELSFLDYRQIKGKNANLVGGSIQYNTKFGFSASVNYKKTPFGEDFKPYDTAYCQLGFQF